MQIVIDEREQALYDKLRGKTGVQKAVLPLGDVTLAFEDHLWLIERKTLADLLASVKDGRYEEQSYRLQHAHDPRRVFYVIEGSLSTLRSEKERTLVHSIMTSLQVFKGFAVVRTASVQETADWLWSAADKMFRDMTIKHKVPVSSEAGTPGPDQYATVVKKVKKDNVTPENMCQILLCQLPGISHVAAMAISRAYPSLLQLMDSLRSDPRCMEGMTTTDKNGKSRKLGKNVHATLANYLMFIAAAARQDPSVAETTAV